MREDPILKFAREFKVPEPAVRQLASKVAEQCALISNRHEPCCCEGTQAVGAEIGAIIMAQFPPVTSERSAGT